MPRTIKVLPTDDTHVGVVHPLDGPLAAGGSDWTHDAFTERQIQARVIRLHEAGADDAPEDEAPAPKAGKAKPQAPA